METCADSNSSDQLLGTHINLDEASSAVVVDRIKKIKIKHKRVLQPPLLLHGDADQQHQQEGEYYVEGNNEEFEDNEAISGVQSSSQEGPEPEPGDLTDAEEMITDSDVGGGDTSDCDNDNNEEVTEDMEGDSIIDDSDLNQDESSLSHKTFKERATELMKKTQGEHSHLVQRTLSSDDWLFIHRIIRKSKGLKSKFMMRNLSPFLFDETYVGSWKCKFCKEMIAAPAADYIAHFAAHSKGLDEDPLFPCDVCGDFIKKDKYVVHWVPHFMEHECPICKKTFALNCHMRYHYKVVHEEGEQTCFQCGKLMKNDLAMRRHLRLFHSNRTNWKICDICGKCVKSRCLEPHKLTHSQDRPYKCDTCKKCFKTPSTLYQHQKVHATDSKAHKYLCEYCGKRFKHHTSWNLHVVRIHEGEYEHECTVCHKRFHKLFELKKHSVKHSEERPFPCSVCGKHFKTKTHLKEHVTIHSEEKSHVCPLCGKGIRMKANLYKHLKVHRNRGEYVPPLNGNSTNLLFNTDYGFPSSMNSISNSHFGSSTKGASTSAKSSSASTASVVNSSTDNTESNKRDSTTSTSSDLVPQNHDSDNVSAARTSESLIASQLREEGPDLTQNAQMNLPIENENVFDCINNLNNQSQYTQDIVDQIAEELTQESTSTILVESEEGHGDHVVQLEDNNDSPTQSEYQQQFLLFDPTTSTILNLQGAHLNSRKNQLQLQPNHPKYECTIINSENNGEVHLTGSDITFSTSNHNNTGNSNNHNHNQNTNIVDLASGLDGTAAMSTLGLGNLSFQGSSCDLGDYLTSPNSLNHISIPSNIFSLIAAPHSENIRINGSAITHFTIMVNHNTLNGLTLAPIQSD